jgi:hypothetical protein
VGEDLELGGSGGSGTVGDHKGGLGSGVVVGVESDALLTTVVLGRGG